MDKGNVSEINKYMTECNKCLSDIVNHVDKHQMATGKITDYMDENQVIHLPPVSVYASRELENLRSRYRLACEQLHLHMQVNWGGEEKQRKQGSS